jgi:hypothetical protein
MLENMGMPTTKEDTVADSTSMGKVSAKHDVFVAMATVAGL